VNPDWLAGPLFWAGFTLSLPQALRVRRSALRLGPAEGPTEGCCGQGPRRRLVGIGDSIIAGVGAGRSDAMLTSCVAHCWAERDGVAVEWQAIGGNGVDAATTTATLVPRLPTENVDRFLVSVGVNDLTGLHGVRRWGADLRQLLAALARHSPGAGICLLAIPPMERFPALPQPLAGTLGLRARTLNRAARACIAGQPRIGHPDYSDLPPLETADFAEDGYHPNAESCRRMAQLLAVPSAYGLGVG
jgi:lysophospholipase L1-like esterase